MLVTLDFPRDSSKLPETIVKQNKEWQSKFGVRGFPTVYFIDADGRPYAKRVGYVDGGPQAYAKILEELRQIRVKRDEELAAAEKAEGIERAKHLDAALSQIDPDLRAHYEEVVKEIAKLDEKNEAGLREKYFAEQDAERRRQALTRIKLASRTAQPDAVLQMIDESLKTHRFPAEMRVDVLQIKLSVLERSERTSDTLALLEELVTDQQLDSYVRDRFRISLLYTLLKLGKPDRALEWADQMIKTDQEEHDRLFFTKGELLARLGRHAEAIESYNRAIAASRDPDFRHEANLAKADTLASADKIDEAIELLDRLAADEQTPAYLKSDTFIQKSLILRDAGRTTDAEKAEQQAIDAAETPEDKSDLRRLIQQLREIGRE